MRAPLCALLQGPTHDMHHACSMLSWPPSLHLSGNKHLMSFCTLRTGWARELTARSYRHDMASTSHRQSAEVQARARRQEKHGQIVLPQLANLPDGRASEEMCASAATFIYSSSPC